MSARCNHRHPRPLVDPNSSCSPFANVSVALHSPFSLSLSHLCHLCHSSWYVSLSLNSSSFRSSPPQTPYSFILPPTSDLLPPQPLLSLSLSCFTIQLQNHFQLSSSVSTVVCFRSSSSSTHSSQPITHHFNDSLDPLRFTVFAIFLKSTPRSPVLYRFGCLGYIKLPRLLRCSSSDHRLRFRCSSHSLSFSYITENITRQKLTRAFRIDHRPSSSRFSFTLPSPSLASSAAITLSCRGPTFLSPLSLSLSLTFMLTKSI
jgi:hypothetical protein